VAGSGPYSIDHINVYAVTLAPGSVPPPNRDLVKPEHVIATIQVRPPPDPDAEAPDPDADKRPAPGDVVTFVEKLTGAQLQPQNIVKPPKTEKLPKEPPAAPVPGAPAVPPPPVGPLVLTRLYALQGRRGEPCGSCQPGSKCAAVAPGLAFRQIDGDGHTVIDECASQRDVGIARRRENHDVDVARLSDGRPLLAQRRDDVLTSGRRPRQRAMLRRPQCRGRRHRADRERSVGSDLRHAAGYLPPAPRAGRGVGKRRDQLIWDANAESDLAGYIVLRGDAQGHSSR
jgi:hypothetical protein